jgi:hypothetical protein
MDNAQRMSYVSNTQSSEYFIVAFGKYMALHLRAEVTDEELETGKSR